MLRLRDCLTLLQRSCAFIAAGFIVFGVSLSTAPAIFAQDEPAPEPQEEKQPEDTETTEEAEDDEGDDETADENAQDEEKASFEEAIEGLDHYEGLFDFYQDPEDGSLKMAVPAELLDRPFIYFAHTVNSPLEMFKFRGAYLANGVFEWQRDFDRLELKRKNLAFTFEEDEALARASEANISDAPIAAMTIEAESEDGSAFLIDADKLFKTNLLQQIAPVLPAQAPPGAFYNPGKLSKSKTRVRQVRTYPENVDLVVDYAFENRKPRNQGSEALADPRFVNVKLQHSFIAAPEEGFEPRVTDWRVGYFVQRRLDLTSKEPAPYRDLVNRWRLEKADPEAELSDPVEPITFWLENTTPVEYRDTIREAVLAWNEAFEAAGFSNAIEVKVQPDDAEWDAGDIRYHVLRWTSSPYPPFGGYGPSFTDPRTGEILGADIMLEYIFLTLRMSYGEIFTDAGLQSVQAPDAVDRAWMEQNHNHTCQLGMHLHGQTLFGQAALQAQGANEDEKERLIKEGLYYLILHEVGHTLGLSHNMRASHHDLSTDEVHDPELTEGKIASSVMDYPSVNFAPPGEDHGDFYNVRPGAYDVWAIEFAYDPDLTEGSQARATHLAQSTKPQYAFGNDADDMRWPGKGTDPRIMIGDMSNEPVSYALERFALVKALLPDLIEKAAEEGESYEAVRQAYLLATAQTAQAASVVSRYIGGVYVNRGAVGQEGAADRPYEPVPLEVQKQAMAALSDGIFSPDAFEAPEELLASLQPKRRDFDFFFNPEDPFLHARALSIQSLALDHLTHPNTLRRMTDSRLYGNDYAVAEMLGDLTSAIIKPDIADPNTVRQNLQIAYLKRLAGIVGSPSYDTVAQSAALFQIQRIEALTSRASMRGSPEALAHRAHLNLIARKTLDQE